MVDRRVIRGLLYAEIVASTCYLRYLGSVYAEVVFRRVGYGGRGR